MLPLGFLKSQCCVKLPYPDQKFTGQTIIITGSNTGIGLEAARHFVRLDAAKVILAVRNLSKGEAAKADIEASEERLGVVEVWPLDLANYASVKIFAVRVQGLERLDAFIANAGICAMDFRLEAGNESNITVNVISTFLLAILLIPKLRKTAVAFDKLPVLTFTGSFVHSHTAFPEREYDNIFDALADESKARMNDRYNVSKLIELFCVRELAREVSESTKKGRIIVSVTNPGFVDTSIMREATFPFSLFVSGLKKTMSRTAEEGGRTLVNAAEGAENTHGQYLDDCKVGHVSAFVESLEGQKTQKRVWTELSRKLERIVPGVKGLI